MYQINNGEYQHFAEFLPSIDNCVSLQFKTKWANAKNPDDYQNKFQLILSKEDMIKLGKQLIEQASE